MSASKNAAAKRTTKARRELGDLTATLAQVAKLKGQALIDRYTEVVGKAPKSKNQHFLRKRIAIELQTGGLTPEKKARIAKTQAYALEHGLWPDLRKARVQVIEAPATEEPASEPPVAAPAPLLADTLPRDPRLPAMGTVLEKTHGNVNHKVTVRADGFEYRGQTYRSLSKVARLITGTTWNGFLYFGLTARKKA